jgi:hypothetical protein
MKGTTALTLPVLLSISTLATAGEKVDLNVVYRIKNEAFQNSKVMEHLSYLTDVHGPRLTGSPGYKAAAEWVVERLGEIGISTARLEKWGPFGRGWSYSRFSAHMIEPSYAPLIGFPLAWSPGTSGPVTAEPVLAVIKTDADFAKFKGKLNGKIVLAEAAKDILPQDKAPLQRYEDKDLNSLFLAPDPAQRSPVGDRPGGPRSEEARKFRNKLNQFYKEEGVLAVINYGYRGDGGTIFAAGGGSRELKDPLPPTMIAITPEQYNRLLRLLDKKLPVKLALDVQAKLEDANLDSFNVIGEIPGTGRHKAEVVMVGAHLDSWHGGTGATDNGAGSAVMIEVMRILKTLNLPLDRTVRIGLWSGEEQGLLGSKAYVKEHFADRETMVTTDQHARFSAYYNLDNGTGKIRGIYLQENDMARPIFDAYLEPFRDLGANTISIRNTGGTDHLSFDAVGLPGFQFIQDSVEYGTRTHHSNMDVYDHTVAGDLMQSSAIIASFVYHTANREEVIPRKLLPKPEPNKPNEKKDEKTLPSAE